nr:unnamed protein product [Callosobruchus chinensis]
MVPLTYICHMIIDLYYIYKMVFLNVSAMSKFHAILHGCRMVTLFLQLFILGYTCEKLCNSANIMPVMLHQYRNEFFDSKIESHIQMYSLQHLHQKVSISALGFFDLELSSIYTVGNPSPPSYLIHFLTST